jgi:DNA-binding PucR family transcriptional regulator
MISTAPGVARVTRFGERPLAIAAVTAADTMRQISDAIFHHVFQLPPEQSSLLLKTLEAWRDNAGSTTATAKTMYCHPNTIRQRLKRLETLTGKSLTNPEATAELLLALHGVQLA